MHEWMGRVNLSRLGLHIVLLALAAIVLGCSGDKGTEPGVNRPPVIADVADTTAVLGDTLFIQIEASDPDGDDLHFNLVIPCSWSELQQGQCPIAAIRSADFLFWFWPRSFDISVRQFMIKVDDGRGGRDSTDFKVGVVPRPK